MFTETPFASSENAVIVISTCPAPFQAGHPDVVRVVRQGARRSIDERGAVIAATAGAADAKRLRAVLGFELHGDDFAMRCEDFRPGALLNHIDILLDPTADGGVAVIGLHRQRLAAEAAQQGAARIPPITRASEMSRMRGRLACIRAKRKVTPRLASESGPRLLALGPR